MTTPRVLIVEDEPGIRLALSGLLRREGYEVAQASDGREAEKLLKAGMYDLVLTDLALGSGPSGMDVLACAREAAPDCPVVMITAHGNEKIAVEAMRRGAEDYVSATTGSAGSSAAARR
jgi:DNA-binding NtrC family response regulator